MLLDLNSNTVEITPRNVVQTAQLIHCCNEEQMSVLDNWPAWRSILRFPFDWLVCFLPVEAGIGPEGKGRRAAHTQLHKPGTGWSDSRQSSPQLQIFQQWLKHPLFKLISISCSLPLYQPGLYSLLQCSSLCFFPKVPKPEYIYRSQLL